MSNQRRLPATLPPPPRPLVTLPPVKQESIPDSSSALAITNRFTPLGSTIGNLRPNYQKALTTPYDPYSSFSFPSPSTPKTPSFAKTSPYLKNPNTEKLLSIPHHIDKTQTPERIAKTLLPPNHFYLPTEPFKSLKYYQAILYETQSLEIKPIPSPSDPNVILYHSIKIQKFLSEKEWGNNSPLYQPLPLHSLEHTFNYYDYIQAWTTIFLHQKSDFSHSWFITFDKNFKLSFPSWFPDWWSSHGPNANLIPDDLRHHLITAFQPKFDRSRFDERVSLFSLFFAKYKIPWILKWNFEIETGCLYRARWVKWWDKFNHQKIIDLIKSDFPVIPSPEIPLPSKQALPEKPDFPQPSKPLEQIQSLSDISHSSSLKGKTSKSSKSSSSKRKEKSSKSSQLLDLAQQLMAEAAMLHKKDDSDSDSSSDASSQQQVLPSGQPVNWADYPNAQDPFDL